MVDLALSPAIIVAAFVSSSPGDSFLDRRFDLIDLQYFLAFRFSTRFGPIRVNFARFGRLCHYFAPMAVTGVDCARLPGFSLLPFWALHRSVGYLYFDLIFDSHQYPGGIDSQHQLISHHSCQFGTIDFGIIVSISGIWVSFLPRSAVRSLSPDSRSRSRSRHQLHLLGLPRARQARLSIPLARLAHTAACGCWARTLLCRPGSTRGYEPKE